MKKQTGFTLIELMVVVVIVAILAAVAIPSYQNSVMKTRRADAKEALTSAAALQERFFFSNNRYAENLGELGLNGTSSEGYYTVILGVPSNSKGGSKNTCETAGQEYPCFSMVASPVNPGPQVGDDKCGQLVVTQTGKKLSYASDNSTDTTDTCWK